MCRIWCHPEAQEREAARYIPIFGFGVKILGFRGVWCLEFWGLGFRGLRAIQRVEVPENLPGLITRDPADHP